MTADDRRLRAAADSMNAALARTPMPDPPRRAGRPWAVALAAAVVVAVVVGGWALLVRNGQQRLDAASGAGTAVDLVERWLDGAVAGEFDLIAPLTYGTAGEPAALDGLARQLAHLAAVQGEPAIGVEHFLSDGDTEYVCVDLAYDTDRVQGGILARPAPDGTLLLWEFRPMEGCLDRDPAATTTGPVATCPVTIPPAEGVAPPAGIPETPPDGVWYGTPELFTALPVEGARWSALPPGADGGVGQKTFWWSDAFVAADEPMPAITVTASRLDREAPEVIESPGTNGNRADVGSFMLVGIELPSTGCWAITADYRGAELSYVVLVTE